MDLSAREAYGHEVGSASVLVYPEVEIPPEAQTLLDLVHRELGVDLGALRAADRSRSSIRQAVFLFMRDLGLSYPKIGAIMERDHSTVIFGCKRCLAATEARKIYLRLRELQYGVPASYEERAVPTVAVPPDAVSCSA